MEEIYPRNSTFHVIKETCLKTDLKELAVTANLAVCRSTGHSKKFDCWLSVDRSVDCV